MVNKKEEYSFSLNPIEDNNAGIYLMGMPEESEGKEEKSIPKNSSKRDFREAKERPVEKIRVSIEKPFKSENNIREKDVKREIKEDKKDIKRTETRVSAGKKIRVIFTAFLLTGLLIFLFLYNSPSITMSLFGSSMVPGAIFVEKIDYSAANDRSFTLDLDYSKFNQNEKLASLGISGYVIGNGKAKVYLVDEEGNEYFLYDNQIETSEKFFKVSGVIISENNEVKGPTTSENATPDKISGFEYSCIDTCNPVLKEGKYTLRVEVDGDSTVKINRLIFEF